MASVWDYVADLIRITKENKPPVSDYLKHLGHPTNITGGPGSDNIPVICTAVHIANLLRIGDQGTARKQLLRAENYLALPWMDREPGSRNAYSELIYEGVECFYCTAHFLGMDSVATMAMDWLQATMVATALGAEPDIPDGNWAGPYITLCGARSGASKKGPSGQRWDAAGIPYSPWFFEDHPLSNRLGWLLGERAHAFVRDLHIGYERQGWVGSIKAHYGGAFAGLVTKLVAGGWDDQALHLLNRIAPPRIQLDFIRGRDGAATVAGPSINYGSTSMMYGLAAWKRPRTNWQGYQMAKHWRMPNLTWLLLDNPAFRQQDKEGRYATVEIREDMEMALGHRDDKKAWHEETVKMQYYPSGKGMPLPMNDRYWWVAWSPAGARLVGEDTPPPPPPPPPPPNGGSGWHTISACVDLKFTDMMAEAALAAIQGGSNHFPVSEAAAMPIVLDKIEQELVKITGGS